MLTYGEAYKELKIYNLFQYFIDKHFEYNKRFNEENLKLKKKSTVQLGGTTIIDWKCSDLYENDYASQVTNNVCVTVIF